MSRPKILDINPNEPVCYPYSIAVNKCSGDCNNINDLMVKLCLPNIVKDMNIKDYLKTKMSMSIDVSYLQ